MAVDTQSTSLYHSDSAATALSQAVGSAVPGAALLAGYSDGVNIQPALVDAGSRQVMVGAAADGAAVAGNPVLAAGSDGANARTLSTDAAGRLNVNSQDAKSATSNVTAVALSTTSATVLAANTDRNGATLYNDSNQAAFVKFGATASATSFTIRLPARGYFEVPYGYTGIIDAVLVSGTGDMRVTEIEA